MQIKNEVSKSRPSKMPSALLDYIYTLSSPLEARALYRFHPFKQSKDRQYPGNVIQYVLMEMEKVDTTRDWGGRTADQWLNYKISSVHKN